MRDLRGVSRDSVFLSYRHDDVPWAAARLADQLEHRLGVGSVFRDVSSIPSGIDFRARLLEAISRCAVGIVVIGPKWHDSFEMKHAEHDYVLWEITTLLRTGKKVIPLLFESASLVGRALPVSLDSIRYLQSTSIRDDTTYGTTIDRLSDVVLSCVGITNSAFEVPALVRFFIDAVADVDDLRSLLLGSPIGRELRARMPSHLASLAEHAAFAANFIADLAETERLLALRDYLIEEIPRYRAEIENTLLRIRPQNATESDRGK